MKKFLCLLIAVGVLTTVTGRDLYFASYPSLSPDGKVLYFSYDGDIFRVDAAGGLALKIVAAEGYQSRPVVSPDGRYIAFSSTEQGNSNVYVVPSGGGEIRQLTWHDGTDRPVAWSPDSKYIYFESTRYNSITTYRVSLEGGTPERLFPHLFNTVVNLVQNPVTGVFYFNESTESYRFQTRKGYKGDHNPDIKCWDEKNQKFSILTTYRGKDIWPMADSQGNLYYVSDEENGEANIVRHSDGKYLTSFDESVQYPSISHDGSVIVFLKGYRISLLDIKTGEVTIPQIDIAHKMPAADISIKTSRPDAFSISPDGKKLAFSYRGLLFVSDAKGDYVRELKTPHDERVMEVAWSHDNKTIYYTQTVKGIAALFSIAADGSNPSMEIYAPGAVLHSLALSADNKKMAFIKGSTALMMMDLVSGQITELSNHEFWAFQNYRITFSEDGRYITYPAVNMFERDIFVYDLEENECFNITNSANTENSPVLDTRNGNRMYMVANRTGASFPRGASTHLYVADLGRKQDPFGIDQYDKLFADKDSVDSSEKMVYPLDIDDIQRRYSPVVKGGVQSNPYIHYSGDRTFLLFNSSHEGSMGLYVQELKEWDKKQPKRVKGAGAIYQYSKGGKVLLGADREGLYKIDPASASAVKISARYSFDKNIKDEFNQMLYDVWGNLDQNFYDVDFHGIDWDAKKDYYVSFLPYVKSRSELRRLVNDMLNELNSSHLGFGSRGREESTYVNYYTAVSGLMFMNDTPYVLDRVVKGSDADYYGNPLKRGDRLVAVNGVEIDEGENRERYFTGAVNHKEIVLTFKREAEVFEVKLHSMSGGKLKELLYTEWEDNNRKITEKLTDGKAAYIHMRDMSSEALERFMVEMNTYGVHKDALILDLRFNNGGNVHQEVIDVLRSREHFRWSYRDKEKVSHPNVVVHGKPVVVLINERSLSDAEVTSNGIRELELATLVGTETYRWIIFTTGVSLVDGSYMRIPAWGCYTLDGKDMEFSGVSPDIYIKNTFEDRIFGRDPQLQRAASEVLSQLEKNY